MPSSHLPAGPGADSGQARRAGQIQDVRRHAGHRAAKLAALGGLGALAAVAATGCSSGSPSNGAASPTPGASVTTSAPVPAGQVLAQVAGAARQITSLAATMNITTGSSTVTGSLQQQVKPVLAEWSIQSSGSGSGIGKEDVLLTGNTIYLKIGELASLTHKPWVAITSSSLGKNSGAGASFSPVVRALQADNPETQAQLLAAGADVQQTGTATVNGTATTEYSGTYTEDTALKTLAPSLRKQLAPFMRSEDVKTVRFSVWVDSQNYVRRLTESAGHDYTVEINITAINQPVMVKVPPASQVGTIPGY